MRFANFIDQFPKAKQLLPVTHKCDVYTFRTILDEGVLRTQECSVFKGEQLLYTYYGRPAYRIKTSKANSLLSYFPICLIFNTKRLGLPKKIYPFDSGAYQSLQSLREKYFHKKMTIQDFKLRTSKATGQRVVEAFYGDNQKYLNIKPKEKLSIPAGELEVLSYYSMITDNSTTDFDDRMSTLEYIYDKDVTISSGVLKGLVVPIDFLNDKAISELLIDKYKIDLIETYKTYRGDPVEYHSEVRTLAMKIIEKNL